MNSEDSDPLKAEAVPSLLWGHIQFVGITVPRLECKHNRTFGKPLNELSSYFLRKVIKYLLPAIICSQLVKEPAFNLGTFLICLLKSRPPPPTRFQWAVH